ncbi:MAG: hypothetical protein IAG13_06320 [Deltaproteobacteria bacterium]|nr:hypothetical protein [Nannocystaceae bacterium]
MANHERKVLVQRPDCRVEQCSCGVYHVSFGAVTHRMRVEQLTSLFEALGVALAPVLEGDEDGDPRVH